MARSKFFCSKIYQILVFTALLFWQGISSAKDILTFEERAWLNAHPQIKLAMWDDYAPISFYDEAGLAQGYMAEYIHLLESQINFKFKQVLPNVADGISNPLTTNADVVSLLADTPIRRNHWLFSPTLLSLPLTLIARGDAPVSLSLSQLEGKKISVVRGYATQEIVETNYPKTQLDLVGDTCEGLQHVAFGQSAAMLTDLPVASWCLKKMGLIDLKVAEKTEFNYEMGVAVRNDWPILLGIIQKGINAIPQNQTEQLNKRWLSQEVFEQDWLKANKAWLAAFVLFLLGAALIRVYLLDNNTQIKMLENVTNITRVGGGQAGTLPRIQNGMVSRIILLLLILLGALGLLISTEQWVNQQDRLLLGVLMTLLMLTMLFGGYKLGSFKRNEENQSLLESLVDQIKIREATELTVTNQTERLRNQQDALAVLTSNQLKDWQTAEEVFREITQISAETLDVDRVSIWLFREDSQQLECVDLYIKSKNLHTIAKPLQANELPLYFSYLRQNRVLAADDVMQHAATIEFTKDYVQENNIGAILDGTIWSDNQIVGVVCHEHTGSSRAWSLDEQNFAGSLADLARLTIETDMRYEAEQALIKHNENLEAIIAKRTSAIENSAKIFQFLFERAPVAIMLMNAERKLLELNPEAEKISGYSREFAVGKTYDELFSSDETKAHNQAFVEKLASGTKLQGEDLLVRRADGTNVELSVSRSVEHDADGNAVIISIAQDNSQRKALQANMQKLLDSEKRFSYVVENAPISILIIDTQGAILEFSPEAERITGYSREQALGKNFIKFLVAKESRKKAVEAAADAIKGQGFSNLDLVLNRADGSKVELECSSSMPAYDINSGKTQLVAIGLDVTQKKSLEASKQKLLDSEKRFSYVVKHATTPIVILDKNGSILDMNPEAVSSSGYEREEMIGKKFFHMLVAKESRKRAIINAAAAFKGEGYRSVELLLQNAKGEKIEYECSLGIVSQDSSGDNDQMVAIAVNISRQKALQQSLIQARESAESADRIKSMFVASMSHELRTPLNSIIGFLGVVLQGMSGDLNLKQKDQLGRAYHSSKHLLSLISDVIDISKIEAGFLQVYVEKFDLNLLLGEVEHAVQHIADEKHLALTIDCPKKLTLETDRKRLYQAVLNVVSNALKYTEQGKVKVTASINGKQVIIVVEDTGIGIDEAGLANLFKPFERAESRLRVKTLGTGLGLYLTRKILTQLLGGSIEVKSKLEQGSTFTIYVPIKMPPIVAKAIASILEEHPL